MRKTLKKTFRRTLTEEIKCSNQDYEIRRLLSDQMQKNGFMYYEPNVFETYDEINSRMHAHQRDETLKVIGGNGEVFILRPDMTSEIIHKFSKHMDLREEYKIFYDGKVFKKHHDIGTESFEKMGLEWINIKNEKRTHEIIGHSVVLLKNVTRDFIFEIGHTKYLDELIRIANLSSVDKNKLIQNIKMKNQEDLQNWLQLHAELPCEVRYLLKNILNLQGTSRCVVNTLSTYEKYIGENYGFNNLEVVNLIREISEDLVNVDYILKNKVSFEMLPSYPSPNQQFMQQTKQQSKQQFGQEKISGFEDKDFHYDLALIPEHDYYDGLIFKAFSKNSYKEILKGGQYIFTTQSESPTKVTSAGFSFEMNALK